MSPKSYSMHGGGTTGYPAPQLLLYPLAVMYMMLSSSTVSSGHFEHVSSCRMGLSPCAPLTMEHAHSTLSALWVFQLDTSALQQHLLSLQQHNSPQARCAPRAQQSGNVNTDKSVVNR